MYWLTHKWFKPTYTAVMMMALTLVLQGCVPEELTDYDFKELQPPSTLPVDKGNVLIGEQEIAGTRVALYIDKGAHTGLNQIGVMLLDAGTGHAYTDALVQLEPVYTVDGEAVNVHFENPATTTANEEGFFEGSAFFLPASPAAGTFSLQISFEISTTQKGQVTFPLDVEESIWMQRLETANGRYFVSWVHPARPTVGKNVFEVAIHEAIAGGYAPLNNARLDLYPYMDMGGGDGHSTPFEAPQYVQEGLYRGAVDFIMAGGWEMTVYINMENNNRESVRFVGYRVYQ